MGIIDGAMGQDQPAQPMQQAQPMQNDASAVIQQMRDQWMEKVPDARKNAVEKLVMAGQKVMFDPKTHDGIMQQFDGIEAESETHKIAVGVAGLLLRLSEKAKGPLPVPALVPTAAILALDALEFLGEAGKIEVTVENAKQVVLDTNAVMAQKLDVGTPEKMAQAKEMMAKTRGSAGLPSQQQPEMGEV